MSAIMKLEHRTGAYDLSYINTIEEKEESILDSSSSYCFDHMYNAAIVSAVLTRYLLSCNRSEIVVSVSLVVDTNWSTCCLLSI